MESSYSQTTKAGKSETNSSFEDLFGPPGVSILKFERRAPGLPSNPQEVAEQLFACESLKFPDVACHQEQEGEPYTLQWFLNIENYRHGREAKWIPRILEFSKHGGERLLGMGQGLGTDWLQYARNGASVVICSSCASQLALVRRNFYLRGLEGRFVHATPTALPLENASIDVACINGLLEQVANQDAIVREVYRVLKPGGKVIAVTPAKYDVAFMRQIALPWNWFRSSPSLLDRKNTRFSARRLKLLFHPFEIHKVYKRQLRRSEVPWPWRIIPTTILERIMGRVLIIKGFKPVSTAISVSVAA